MNLIKNRNGENKMMRSMAIFKAPFMEMQNPEVKSLIKNMNRLSRDLGNLSKGLFRIRQKMSFHFR